MLASAIALINEILALIEQIGPIVAAGIADLSPVVTIMGKIISGQTLNDSDLATLQGVSDNLHAHIQASPES